eukprot:365309-Chlamydomonas_euryale.AAC.16
MDVLSENSEQGGSGSNSSSGSAPTSGSALHADRSGSFQSGLDKGCTDPVDIDMLFHTIVLSLLRLAQPAVFFICVGWVELVKALKGAQAMQQALMKEYEALLVYFGENLNSTNNDVEFWAAIACFVDKFAAAQKAILRDRADAQEREARRRQREEQKIEAATRRRANKQGELKLHESRARLMGRAPGQAGSKPRANRQEQHSGDGLLPPAAVLSCDRHELHPATEKAYPHDKRQLHASRRASGASKTMGEHAYSAAMHKRSSLASGPPVTLLSTESQVQGSHPVPQALAGSHAAWPRRMRSDRQCLVERDRDNNSVHRWHSSRYGRISPGANALDLANRMAVHARMAAAAARMATLAAERHEGGVRIGTDEQFLDLQVGKDLRFPNTRVSWEGGYLG